MRVLLVDDEPQILRAMERLFHRRGHEVRAAAGPHAAIGELERFVPEMVISDFKMPGMNGIELLRIIAERVPAARLILLSGDAEVDDTSDVVYVSKPCDPQALLRLCE